MSESALPAQIQLAVGMFRPVEGFDWKWHPGPVDGNYDPAATLSATLHTVEMATQSSPIQIALYRKGEFLAQGSPLSGAFIKVLPDESTDDTVAIEIRIPGDDGFKSTKSTHVIKYHYRDGRIYWSGDWPSEFTVPGFPNLPAE
ncbi:hypothetical protein A5761_02895 [Mycolicibacterium setense]|uniref:LppP/LprE family lipoprotein n=1 Tax=Mycolicibacterium setense TaxID=431269 RepID=UPI0003A18B3F|nr:LppP/LprE family lipoprotein [Mycolicibacterium setense]OBB21073.1 hypothetical protein A5761_02895 [Mycolicibacterium setense]